MPYRIYITPTAVLDMDEIVTYCNGKRDGLGYRFADEAHDNFASLVQVLC